jgi:hypothetical protein
MSKLNQWLTLVANVSVVIGIVFLAVEMRQNTQAIQAQTRDAITEKQMEYISWLATSPELAAGLEKLQAEGWESLSTSEGTPVTAYAAGFLREAENSHYQYRNGLFTPEEYEARTQFWRLVLTGNNAPAFAAVWQRFRLGWSPSFRAEIDRILAEVEQAQ